MNTPHRLVAALCLPLITLTAPSFAQSAGYSGHGADSLSPATLEQFRAAPLPDPISRRIQSLLDLRSPSSGVLAPDGKRLFFTWRVTGTDQIWRVDGPERFPVQMTGGEDRTLPLAVTPDGKWLVLSRDRKGEEYPGLYLQPVEGGPLKLVQHLPKVQTFFGFVSRDSQALYFVANEKAPNHYTVFRYDIASGTKTAVFDQPGLWRIADHADDGKLLLVRLIDSQAREYVLYDPATQQSTPLFGQNEKFEYAAAFGPRPGELFVLTPKFGDFRRLYRWRDGKFDPVTPELNWDVSGFSLDPAKKRLYYAVNEAGYTRSTALDATTLKVLPVQWPRDADHQTFGTTSQDGRYVTLATVKARRATYVWDWQTNKLTQWVVGSMPEEDSKRFAVASLEHYVARDGTKIPMFVRRPPGCDTQVCPVLVHFHGGPEGQSRAGFSPIWQLFIDAGFIVADPNVRGSEGYGRRWRDADNGARRLDVITDIEDAATWIKQNWAKNGVAPRLGVFGGSYGGYSTLMAMTRFAGAYDAGVSVVGISNLNTFLKNTAPYRRALRISEYGDPETQSEMLAQLSPVTYIDRLKAPLMIIQGATDPRVPVGEAVQMYEAAKARGTPVELMIFADEGHGAAKRDNQAMEWGHMLRFFEQHLKR